MSLELPDQTADRLELIELAGRYGTLIDHRDWPSLADIFAPDAEFDLTSIKHGVLTGLPMIQEFMEHRATHPPAHLISNIFVQSLERATGRVSSRLLAVQTDGSVIAGEYADAVAKTTAGWRISHRRFTYIRRAR